MLHKAPLLDATDERSEPKELLARATKPISLEVGVLLPIKSVDVPESDPEPKGNLKDLYKRRCRNDEPISKLVESLVLARLDCDVVGRNRQGPCMCSVLEPPETDTLAAGRVLWREANRDLLLATKVRVVALDAVVEPTHPSRLQKLEYQRNPHLPDDQLDRRPLEGR